MEHTIPTVDFGPYVHDGSHQDKMETAMSILKASSSTGFYYLKNHGFLEEDIDFAFDVSRRFFENTAYDKEKFAIAQGAHGYTAMGQESLDAKNPNPEPKEAFNIRRMSAGQDHKLPPTIRENKNRVLKFWRECHALGKMLMSAYALVLQIPEDQGGIEYFSGMHHADEASGSTLRFLHYPPAASVENGPDSIRAGCHSDYGSLTILFQHAVEGLQIMVPSKSMDDQSQQTFINVAPIKQHLVINVGDLFQFWTSSVCLSAQHRVVCPRSSLQQKASRYSIAYFFHPDNDVPIEPIPSPIIQEVRSKDESSAPDENSGTTSIRQIENARMKRLARYLPSRFTAGEYLQSRLDSTYKY